MSMSNFNIDTYLTSVQLSFSYTYLGLKKGCSIVTSTLGGELYQEKGEDFLNRKVTEKRVILY